MKALSNNAGTLSNAFLTSNLNNGICSKGRISTEQQEQLKTYTNEKTDAIYQQTFERMALSRRPEQEIAAWDGTVKQVQDARESAPNDPEYLAQREQLEQFHAARSEAASLAINEVQQSVLRERNLANVETDGEQARTQSQDITRELPENPKNELHFPVGDAMDKAAEQREASANSPEHQKLARIREALGRLDTHNEGSGQNRDRGPDQD